MLLMVKKTMKRPSVRDDKDDIFIMLNSTFFMLGVVKV